MAQLSTFYTMMRAAVSGDKYRLRSGQYDLDLTYITDRVIAMGFPADGVESAFRNWIDDVAGYLKERHRDSFMVFNLCEREYSCEKFDHQVHRFAFPDHHPPPLPLLSRLCFSMLSWLKSSPSNVVAVHCLAGKGRTGTVIAAFLIYAGLFDNAADALNFFALKRSSNNWGVTSPSQKRYVQYFADMVVQSKVPHGRPLRIPQIVISPIASISLIYVEIYDASRGVPLELLATSSRKDIHELSQIFPIKVELAGDYLVSVKMVRAFLAPVEICRLSFNTGMVDLESLHLCFDKLDIDTANEDERFPPDFKIDLYLGAGDSPYVDTEAWIKIPPRDGAICYNEPDAQEKANRIRSAVPAEIVAVKGGYLTKQGEKVRSWKKRWFVLKGRVLTYFNQPKDTTPLGTIPLQEIVGIIPLHDTHSLHFEILTVQRRYHIMSASKEDRDDWINALRIAASNLKAQSLLPGTPKVDIMVQVEIIELLMHPQFLSSLPPYWKGVYVVLSLDHQLFISETVWDFTPRPHFHQAFRFNATGLYPPVTLNALVFMRTSEESPNTTDLPIGSAFINFDGADQTKETSCWWPTLKHETHERTGVDLHLVLRFGDAATVSPDPTRRFVPNLSSPSTLSPLHHSDGLVVRRVASSPSTNISQDRDVSTPAHYSPSSPPLAPLRSSYTSPTSLSFPTLGPSAPIPSASPSSSYTQPLLAPSSSSSSSPSASSSPSIPISSSPLPTACASSSPTTLSSDPWYVIGTPPTL